MGARIALNRASALHDSNRWPVSLEFSLAALFPSGLAICAAEALRLKPGSPTPATTALGLVVLTGAATLIFHTAGDMLFRSLGLLVDWLRFGFVWNFSYAVPILDRGPPRDHVLRVSRHISLRSDELRSPALQFFSRTA